MNIKAKMFNKQARQNSDIILKSLDLKNKTIADLGSGGGHFSLEFAKEANKIYSLDINKKFLNYINRQANKNKTNNLKTIHVKNKINLPEKVDLIFLRNVFHHLENRIKLFQQLGHYLKQNGKIIIVEREKGNHGTKKQIIIKELNKGGYKLKEDLNALNKENFLIFIK